MQGKVTDFLVHFQPTSFGQIIGQSGPVKWCENELLTRRGCNAYFVGEVGCGKTTIARLYGRSLACVGHGKTADKPIDPCGTCSSCTDEQGINAAYRRFNGAALKLDELKDVLGAAKHPRWDEARTVIHIDEAHALKPACVDLLLTELEPQQQKGRFTAVFSTSRERKFVTLQQRCEVLKIGAVSETELRGLASKICQEIGLPRDKGKIDNVIYQAKGAPRLLLKAMQRWYDQNPIESIASAQDEASVQAVRLLENLLDGSLQTAYDIAHTTDPAELRDALINVLTDLQYSALGVRLNEDRLSANVERLSRLQESGAALSKQMRLSRTQFWQALLEKWREHASQSLNGMQRQLLAAHTWLSDTHRAAGLHLQPLSIFAAPSRSRPHVRWTATNVGGGFLGVEEIVKIWDAGSFHAQHYGKYFNVGIFIDHARLSHGDDNVASRFVSILIKEFSARVLNWHGFTLASIYTHAKIASDICTTIAFYVPEQSIERTRDWLFRMYLGRKIETLSDGAVVFDWVSPRSVRSAAQFHRKLMAQLCRSVDPGLKLRSSGRLLIDEIGVKQENRHAFEPLSCQKYAISKPIRERLIRNLESLALLPLTPGRDGAYGYHNSGWELAENKDRTKQRERILNANEADRSVMLRDLSGDPILRPRSWPTPENPGWWI